MKKMLSLLLVLMMVITGMPVLAEDANVWAITPEGALKINSEVKLSGEVIIPETVDGVTVTAIEQAAFNNQTDVTSIVMPDTVQSMYGNSINFLNNLTSLKLSENLTVIDDMNGCLKALTDITMPASVRYIGDSFTSLKALQTMTFEGVCPVFNSDDPLYGMNSSAVIYVPDDQVDAYKEALAGDYDIDALVQPSGKNAVVYECAAPEADFVFDAATGTITGYTGGMAYLQIPATIGGTAVKAIGDNAFKGNTEVFYVTIPEGVETIGNYAFNYCDSLIVVEFPTTLKKIGDNAFEGCYLDYIVWAEGLEEIGANAFARLGMRELHLPSTVKTIGEAAFKNGSIVKLYLGKATESIGAEAFANNYIDRIELPVDRMIEIDATAFDGNTGETDVYLGWNVPIDAYKEYEHLFMDIYPGYTYMSIQAPIKDPSLGLEYPADGTDSYSNEVWVSYNGTQPNLMTWYSWNRIPITTLGDGLFKGNQTIKSWYPTHSFTVHHIGNEAFADSSVEVVDLFHEIHTIGDAAFRNCVNIKEITLPETLTSIAPNAFEGCTGLEKITILCDPSVIPEGLVDTCTALTEISAGPDATEEENLMMTFALYGMPEVTIEQQPADVTVAEGETASATVAATGESLTYAWYVNDSLYEDVTGDSFSVEMTDEYDGAVIYCVVTDVYGTSATSEKATLKMAAELAITLQPAGVELPEGETADITVEATGDGLTYQWYVMPGDKGNYEVAEGFNTNVYSVVVNAESDWSQVYCEITDAYGNTVTSEPASIFMAEPQVVVPEGTADPAYVGRWEAVSADIEGMVLDKEMLAEFGMDMWFDLSADGTAVMLMEGQEIGGISWIVAEGVLYLTLEGDTLPIEINEDGAFNFEGITFEKAGEGEETTNAPAAPAAPSEPVEVGEIPGRWVATGAEMDGVEMDADMLAMFGMDIELNLNEDGTGSMMMAGEAMEMTWSADETGVTLTAEGDSVVFAINEKGGLTWDLGDNSLLYLEKGDGESAQTPVDAPAEVDTAALIGTWFDGDAVNFTIHEDGTCVAVDQYGESWMEWEVVDGVPMITSGMWSEAPLTLNADGTLYVCDGWIVDSTFTFGEGEIRTGSTLTGAADAVPAASADEFFGAWKGETMEMESGSFALSDFGMTMNLTISEDGTLTLDDGAFSESTEWTFADGALTAEDGMVEISLLADGRLCMDQEFQILYLSRADGEATQTEPEVVPAAPEATDVDISLLLGAWNDGEGTTFTIYEDGSCVALDEYGESLMEWAVVDGVPMITTGWWCDAPLLLKDDDTLYINDGWAVDATFVRGEAEPVAPPATVQTGDAETVYAEMEDFVGLWTGKSMEMDGKAYALSDFGMTMEIELKADGSITLFDGVNTEVGAWTMVDGAADIDGMILTLMSDGTAVATDPEGAKVVFTGFVGTWKSVYLSTGGLTGDLRSMGISSTLTLNADGTGSIDFPTPEEGSWYREDGLVRFGANGMPMELLSGGFLKFGSDLAGYMIFSQDENAVWDPATAVPAATEVPAMPVVTPAPAAPAAPETPSAGADVDMAALMEKKFVAKTFTSAGYTMDASAMGEYSLLFHEDGNCDFGMAGMVVTNLPWGHQKVSVGLNEVDAFVINYFGTMFNAVITEEGFDMDFYGSMMLHFVPAE